MVKKKKILEPRERLDKTLALPDLANEESIKLLVKNQLCCSSLSQIEGDTEQIVERRSKQVSNFVEMLQSASTNEQKTKAHGISHNDWKIKQDTDQFRVMYRPGPHGSPFHSLLMEGYADGPIDVCLCVSWEATLYNKWWPQYNIPTFKIIKSTCLHKVRVGEEISLVRVKVPWPVSDREALVHYYQIEYPEEDLILVLTNTVSEEELAEVSTDGFNMNGTPEVVRVDMDGGLVLQKIDHCRSYFRVIANMDIKLDFVPPSLINFISRQLLGNGHKLYQKAVSTVATTDEDYQKALEGPMYARIRNGVNPTSKTKTDLACFDEKKVNGLPTLPPEEHTGETATETQAVRDDTFTSEIVEEETEPAAHLKPTQPNDTHASNINAFISPEVQAAVAILDDAIAILRNRAPSDNQTDCSSADAGLSAPEAPTNTIISGHNMETSALENKVTVLVSETESAINTTKPSLSESINKVCDVESIRANGFHQKGHRGHGGKAQKGRKKWLSCLSK